MLNFIGSKHRLLWVCIFAFFGGLFAANSALAMNKPVIFKAFEIKRGSLRISQSFCPPGQCQDLRASLSGQVVASINTRRITFAESFLSNPEKITFQLPKDPNLDSNGTTRQATFRLKGQYLFVKGQVNSSAFDGPVIDYQFVAKMQKGTPAQATTAYYRLENKGIFCISTPCFSYSVSLLNKKSVQETPISRLDFPEDNALSEKVFEAQRRLGDGESLVVLGRIETYQGFAGTGRALRIKDWFISGLND